MITQVVLVGSLGLSFLFAFYLLVRKFGKEKWKEETEKEHPSRKAILISSLKVNLASPFWEEAAFRGPLLILFSQFDEWAWPAIFISAALFGLMHIKRERLFPILKKEEYKDARRVANIVGPILAFGIGVLCGWIVISTQCLWWAVLAHVLWNLLGPVLIALFMVGGLLLLEKIKR